ncbi:MAG: tRNA (adenosine(37)-N6)-threonylcarbamoyltransferase complex dimerization subunit type 1 TsaB [Bacteroidota bacterium]
MNILLLETATEVCSVGLLKDGTPAGEIVAADVFQHARHLTIFIQSCLREANLSFSELDYVALSHGPGSYTSLRVGAATAKGLCLAIPGLKLLAIDTLASLAHAASIEALPEQPTSAVTYLPTIKSRRGEVYARAFNSHIQPIDVLRAEELSPSSFSELRMQNKVVICGSGTERVKEFIGEADDLIYRPEIICRATNLASEALQLVVTKRTEDCASYEPLYLKPPFVTKSTKKLL